MNRLMRKVVRIDSDRMTSAAVEESRSPMYIVDPLRSLPRREVAFPSVFDSCLVLNPYAVHSGFGGVMEGGGVSADEKQERRQVDGEVYEHRTSRTNTTRRNERCSI
jgi:hypothetical protein